MGKYAAIVALVRDPAKLDIPGAILLPPPYLRTPEDWCAYYGVTVTDGVAILYKALNEDFTSPRGLLYAPGATAEALDWDDGAAECGGGLHFSPSATAALEFHPTAKRFVACPVALADMRGPCPTDGMPQKAKARRVCGPIVEVDRDGVPVPKAAGEAA